MCHFYLIVVRQYSYSLTESYHCKSSRPSKCSLIDYEKDSLGSADVLHLKMSPPEAFSVPRGPFPFKSAHLSTDGVRTQIEQKLPSFQRASALVEAYLENTAWLVRLVHREQIMEELIPQIYRRRPYTNHSPREEHTSRDPHTLALLLAIFACGAVADLTLPPWNEEARLYYDLACTAIGLRSVFDGTSLHAVQALAVLASYDIFACRRNSLEGTWKLISFCMSLAASVGVSSRLIRVQGSLLTTPVDWFTSVPCGRLQAVMFSNRLSPS